MQDYNEVDQKRVTILLMIIHINHFKHRKTEHENKFSDIYYYYILALKFLRNLLFESPTGFEAKCSTIPVDRCSIQYYTHFILIRLGQCC